MGRARHNVDRRGWLAARFEGPSHIGWHMVLQNSVEGCGRGGGGFKMLLQLKI